jgi:hypothetical protein
MPLEKSDCRVRVALTSLLLWVSAIPLPAETFEGCSWTGPDLDWVLERTLPALDVEGSLSSDVVEFLHRAGVPISFISRSAEDPEVRFQHPEGATVRDLLEDVLVQAPGYRLDVVNGKPVIYPISEGYDALIDLGDPYQAKRASALLSVLPELRSKSPALSSLRLPTFKWLTGYGDLIVVGGVRTVVEHLVSLVAGRPSFALLILRRADGLMDSGLSKVDIIRDFFLEAPKKVKIGAKFQAVPRVVLADGSLVTLIGSGCGVEYESPAESILKVNRGGLAVATAKGTSLVQAKYEGIAVYAEIEVTDD